MSNRIRRVVVTDQNVAPAVAEVWVTVHLDEITPTTEIRGRLMGPTCRYASTVEVAYPLRPLAKSQKPPASDDPSLTMRVVIPEPSFWDPQCPFLYGGPIELCQDGKRVEMVTFRHALSYRKLGAQLLRWNGRPLTLRGRAVDTCSEEEMLALRTAGYNLILTPVQADTISLAETADRIGFLLLGRVKKLDDPLAADIANHPSCFGFLVDEEMTLPFRRADLEEFLRQTRALIGVELHTALAQQLPPEFSFLLTTPEERDAMARFGLLLILRGKCEVGAAAAMGWIEF